MKFALMILLFISSLFSYDSLLIKAKILSQIAHEVVKKDIVNIYVEDSSLAKTKDLVKSLNYTSYDKADLVFTLGKDGRKYKSNKKYIFTTSYYSYHKNPNILGVFFWQKGRPNIIIRSKVANKLHISFSNSFKKYME